MAVNYLDTGVPGITSHESSVILGYGLIIGIGITIIYLIPTLIAFYRDHDYKWIIMIINLILGMTLLAWVGVFVWSLWPTQNQLKQRAADRARFAISTRDTYLTFAILMWGFVLFVIAGVAYFIYSI